MHTLTWFIWAICLFSIALTTRNPLYLSLILLVTQVVRSAVSRTDGGTQSAWSVARFAAIVIPLSAIFNALSVHLGDSVLFVIPGDLPLISGNVTLEALVYGAINGLMLTTVLAIFNTLNSAVAPSEWMRFVPRAFQSMGMTLSIALGFIPQVSRRTNEIRDAQAIRGHRVKGLRGWLPLWMPLLTNGLEHSMQSSEAMVARGFGATQSRAASLRTQGLTLAGLALVLLGWLARFTPIQFNWTGFALIAIGAVCILIGLRQGTRNTPHTTYRQHPIHAIDIVCSIVSIGAVALILLAALFGQAESLFYYPYPVLTWPQFEVWIGAGLSAFLAPLLSGRG